MKRTVRRGHAAAFAAAVGFAMIVPASVLAAGAPARAPVQQAFDIDIPALPLKQAARRLFDQIPHLRNFQPHNRVAARVRTNAVRGRYSSEEALRRLLEGTGITYELSGNFVRFKVSGPLRKTPPPSPPPSPEGASAIPEVLIATERSFNSQMERTNDGVQPVTVLTSEDLESSSYLTVGEFLQGEVSSHVKSAVPTAAGAIAGDGRQLNLLGLGVNQTVVLIDGQQRAQTNAGGVAQQSMLDNLPLTRVERIEVLTGAASSQAGPGALGGLINVVLKKGADTGVMVHGDRYAGMSAGAALLEGAKVVDLPGHGWMSFSAGMAWHDRILVRDDNSLTEGRRRSARNNPSLLASPPLGAETNVMSVDGTALLPDGRFPYLSVPADWDGDLAKLYTRDGIYNYDLAPTSQDRGGGNVTLQPARRHMQANFAGKFPLADSWLADIDVGFSQETRWGNISFADEVIGRTYFLPANSNPFGKNIYVTREMPFGDGIMTGEQQSRYATGGLLYSFGERSLIRLSHSFSQAWARTTQPWLRISEAAPGASSGGLLERPPFSWSLENVTTPRATSRLEDTTLMFSTPVAGNADDLHDDPVLTITAQRKHQDVENPDPLFAGVLGGALSSDDASVAERSQDMYSVQGELSLPLYLSEAREPTLQAEISARADSYSISLPGVTSRNARFESFNEAFALGWRPTGWFLLRGGYSTGFVPPSLELLTAPVEQWVPQLPVRDPLRNGELIGPVTLLIGGNLDLRPEEAQTWRAGFVLEALDDSLRFSLDFTRVLKVDAILGSEDLFFGDPDGHMRRFPDSIHREVTTDGTVGRIVSVDSYAINVARQDVRAFEFSSSWKLDLDSWGKLHLKTHGTWVSAFERRMTSDSLEIDNAGVLTLGPPRLRLNTAVIYQSGPWQAGVKSRFTSANRVSRDKVVIASQGGETVGSQHYHDIFLSYSMAAFASDAWLTFRLDVRNVLRADPPYDASEVYYENRYGVDERPLYRMSVGLRF